jgi:hypothetical protein
MNQLPPVYRLDDIGQQVQGLARDCKNELLAMFLQSVAIGSMIIMASSAAAHLLRDLLGRDDQGIKMTRACRFVQARLGANVRSHEPGRANGS